MAPTDAGIDPCIPSGNPGHIGATPPPSIRCPQQPRDDRLPEHRHRPPRPPTQAPNPNPHETSWTRRERRCWYALSAHARAWGGAGKRQSGATAEAVRSGSEREAEVRHDRTCAAQQVVGMCGRGIGVDSGCRRFEPRRHRTPLLTPHTNAARRMAVVCTAGSWMRRCESARRACRWHPAVRDRCVRSRGDEEEAHAPARRGRAARSARAFSPIPDLAKTTRRN